ncbi:MAG: isoaspartyl peptidase/L-asparaginase [candidate division Zixibacteria bacterium]|nr:isoaspartyl peptidase/L-asparaginase [candidate division Zixibacteria bacterium]
MSVDSYTNLSAIAIHGGAGTILRANLTDEKERDIRAKLTESLEAGNVVLEAGGSAVDAVQAAVVVMEESPLFNAGKGAVYTHDGSHEQDACLMDGATRNVGAVAAVKRVRNPILLARLVLDQSTHVLLSGEGAETFATTNGMELVDDQSYFDTEFRYQQLQKAIAREKKENKQHTQLDHSDVEDKIGTVGAVAVDRHGNLAAATSTGGMTNKRHGRIGDTPVVGAGTFADNKTCAVSSTGVGEYIMRAMLAYDIAALMEYKNLTLEEAGHIAVMEKFTELGGDGGVIAIDALGNIAMPFNSSGMYRGWMRADGTSEVKIFKE